MSSEANRYGFFLHMVLIVGQAVQAVTPDSGSMASSRLIRMIEDEAKSRSFSVLELDAHQENPVDGRGIPAPAGSLPFEEPDQSDEPDEVCLTASSARSHFRRLMAIQSSSETPRSLHAIRPSILPIRLAALFKSAQTLDEAPNPRSLCSMKC